MTANLARQAATGAKWITASSIAIALVSLLRVSILARYLHPEDFGAVAWLLIILEFCTTFVRTGFSEAIVINRDATARQLSTLFWLNSAAGLVVYGVIFAAAPLIERFFTMDGLADMGRTLGLILPLGAMVVQFDALMRRELLLRGLALARIAGQVVSLFVAIWLAVEGFGAWSLVISALVAQVVQSALLILAAAIHGWLPGRGGPLADIRHFVTFGAWRMGANLLNVLNSRIDQLAIGAALGPVALGYYNLAFNLAMQPFLRINPILTQISFPVFAQVRDDEARLLRGYRRGLRLLIAVNAPLLMGLAATAPLVVPLMLGPGWDEVVPLVQVLAVAILFRSAANINSGLILAKGKVTWPFYANLAMIGVVPGAILLTMQFSPTLLAVCIALTVIHCLLFAVGYVIFARRLLGGFDLRQMVNDAGRPVLASILMVPFTLIAMTHAPGPLALQATLAVGVGALAYALVSLLIQRQHTTEVIEFMRMRT